MACLGLKHCVAALHTIRGVDSIKIDCGTDYLDVSESGRRMSSVKRALREGKFWIARWPMTTITLWTRRSWKDYLRMQASQLWWWRTEDVARADWIYTRIFDPRVDQL